MTEVTNNTISQNPDQNRIKRIAEAQKYHSPVEAKIRDYKDRVAAVNPAKVKERDTSLEDAVGPDGRLYITVRPLPKNPTEKPTENANGSGPVQVAQNQAQPSAPANGGEAGPVTSQGNGGTQALTLPTPPPRRSIDKNGSVYVVEDREDGPHVIARQPAPFAPIRMYEKGGVKVTEEDLLPDDERTFMDKALAGTKDFAVGYGDATEQLFTGLGLGVTKFATNTVRTLVDTPIGDYAFTKEGADKFDKISSEFLKNLDTEAAKLPKTSAGKVAQGVGDIAGNFIGPAIAGYKALVAVGASPLTASMLSEGLTAVLGTNPDAENLSDLIQKDSKFAPIRELFGTDPDDPKWVNRAKNAAETFALMGMGEAAIKGTVKAIKETKTLSKTVPANVMSLIDRTVQKAGEIVSSVGKNPKSVGTALIGGGAAAVALSPEEAQANARTETLQKAISLLNDTSTAVTKFEIDGATVDKMLEAAKDGGNAAKGIDFNLNRIENSEELGNIIDQISTVYEKKIYKAKGGVQSFNETELKAQMSLEMGFNVDDVLKRQEGELWPAHKMKAARDLFVSQVQKTKDMALAIKQPGGNSEDALLAFRRQMAVTAAVQMQIKGAQTEVARALSQFRMTAKSPLEARVQIREMIDVSGGADVNEEMVDAFLNAVDNGGPDAAAIFTRQANNATTTEMLYEAWINSLLGSPTTHMVNMTGNSLTTVQGVMERYAAAGYGTVERAGQRALGRPVSDGGITFDEANAYAAGLYGSVKDAMQAFGRALKTGKQSDLYGKLDYQGAAITAKNINELPISKSIAGRFGKDEMIDSNSKLALMIDYLGEYYYRLPGRFLMAEDDLFKTLNYRAELHARISREADQMRKSGLSDEEINMRRDEILRDPQVAAPDIHLGSIDQMREQTFTSPQGEIAKNLNKFLTTAKIGDFPAGRVVVPFFNVINNILKYAAARTPGLALINPKSKTFQDLFSNDAARRQMVMGKWTTGGAIMGSASYLTLNGVCTGRLTDNPKLKAQMEAQGKKPFSCMVPQLDGSYKAVQYNRLDPIGMTMGIAATTTEALHYIDSEQDREMLVIAATAAIMPYMEEKSYFSGISDFMNALSPQYGDDEARINAMSKYFQGVAASAPGAVLGPLAPGTPLSSFVNREIVGDNTRRTANASPYRIEKDAWGDDVLVTNDYRFWEGTIKKIMSRTPGLADNLPARKNIWGEDQVMENGVFSDGVLSPLYSSTIKYDVRKLRNANVPDKIKSGYFYGQKIGQDMTLDQFSEFVNIVGINGELERLGAPIAMPRKQISAKNGSAAVGLPVDLNDQQYADFLEYMNKISVPNGYDPLNRRMNLQQALDFMVKQPEYARLPEDIDARGSKGDMLRALAGKYKDAATNVFLSQHKDGPILQKKSIELKLKAQNTGVR